MMNNYNNSISVPESYTSNSISSLLVYENKYYQRVYLDSCAYNIVNTEMVYYFDGKSFESYKYWIVFAKNNNSKKSTFCHYWSFNQVPRFCICNGYHGFTMLFLNHNDVSSITVKVLIIAALFIKFANQI